MARICQTMLQYDLPSQLSRLLQAVFATRYLKGGVSTEQVLADVLRACQNANMEAGGEVLQKRGIKLPQRLPFTP